ncbi:VOC family protein [Vaginisenegalia massiliensis]|uniref:VOC family protein n=1 Tax=Vaginisenegalia massiliensis TaxID=2058294 RepID=UPI000F52735E|nr:VOC family protein [Vaginisenegalia massiliensis]
MKSLWINLPVKDIAAAISFYGSIGFKVNMGPMPQIAMAHIGESKILLVERQAFSEMLPNQLVDPNQANEVLLSIEVADAAKLDRIVESIKLFGGQILLGPSMINGYYGCLFTDPDGHKFNLMVLPEQ